MDNRRSDPPPSPYTPEHRTPLQPRAGPTPSQPGLNLHGNAYSDPRLNSGGGAFTTPHTTTTTPGAPRHVNPPRGSETLIPPIAFQGFAPPPVPRGRGRGSGSPLTTIQRIINEEQVAPVDRIDEIEYLEARRQWLLERLGSVQQQLNGLTGGERTSPISNLVTSPSAGYRRQSRQGGGQGLGPNQELFKPAINF